MYGLFHSKNSLGRQHLLKSGRGHGPWGVSGSLGLPYEERDHVEESELPPQNRSKQRQDLAGDLQEHPHGDLQRDH